MLRSDNNIIFCLEYGLLDVKAIDLKVCQGFLILTYMTAYSSLEQVVYLSPGWESFSDAAIAVALAEQIREESPQASMAVN